MSKMYLYNFLLLICLLWGQDITRVDAMTLSSKKNNVRRSSISQSIAATRKFEQKSSETHDDTRHDEKIKLLPACAPRHWSTCQPTTDSRVSSLSVLATCATLRGGGGGAAAVTSSVVANPGLISWLFPGLACATSYAMYNLCIKKASSSIDPIVGGVLLQVVAALFGVALLGIRQLLMAQSNGISTMKMTKVGLLWAVAAGASVGAAEILSFVISSMGVPATQSIPFLVGGSIVIGTILGAIWLQEKMTWTGRLGVVMIAVGIALTGGSIG